MDSFELNKIAGAILGTLLFVMGLGVISSILFNPGVPLVPGYDLPAAEEAGEGAGAAPAVVVPPIALRLTTADPARGQKAVAKCAACHTFTPGGPVKTGPNLFNIVERTIGAAEGFGYTAGMREHATKGDKWTYESLDTFIHAPKQFVPGTAMNFVGIGKPDERADIIAYLRTLSDNPAPLPPPPAEAPAENGGTETGSAQPAAPPK